MDRQDDTTSGHGTTLVLQAPSGLRVELSTLGAAVHRLEVPLPDGTRRNVVLNHDSPASRLASGDYIGGTIGRYANRIAGGRFSLDGHDHVVRTHDRGNSLHGGPDGFDRRVWTVVERDATAATLELTSPDGDMGFPGRLVARTTYSVSDDAVQVRMTATTDRPTVVNLTNHAYLNLDGGGTTIDAHHLTVPASRYTPVDGTGIPLGDHLPVDGTPFDLRSGARLGDALRSDHAQVRASRGIDHNLVVEGSGLRTVAVLTSSDGSLTCEVRSDQPGLQVYTANALDGSHTDDRGRMLRQGDGIALEPQRHPDTPNRPSWPSAVLRPGEQYEHTLAWVLRSSQDART